MFFIMWMHAGAGPSWLGKPVGGAICLFFLLAGYFMPRDAGDCARRALKLGLAWLLWSLISLGLFMLCKPDTALSWQKAIGWGTAAYNTPLWFLRNLAIYQLVIAALAALRVFPRYNWVVLVLIISFHWAAAPRQHMGLRFDWMQAVLLGYCLRCVSLDSIADWLRRHAIGIVLCIGIMYLQRAYHPDLLRLFGISTYGCSLPMEALSYAILFCLAGLGIEHYLPRVARPMATAGAGMLFIYATHSFLYAPIYRFKIHGFYDVWAPVAGLIMLALLGSWLTRRFPRVMRVLGAK